MFVKVSFVLFLTIYATKQITAGGGKLALIWTKDITVTSNNVSIKLWAWAQMVRLQAMMTILASVNQI